MNKKRRGWIIAGILALLAGFFIYPQARNSWLIHRARDSFAKGQDHKASLQALHIFQIDPGYTPAAKLLADIAEKNLSKEALRWRLSATKNDPSPENEIALARTAVYFQEWEMANQAFLAVKPKDRQTVTYMQAAGAMALALDRYEDAAHFFEKALQMEPDNKTLLLNLSITRLALHDAALQSKARQDLEKLKQSPDFARAATLALLQDALAHNSAPETIARELLAYPSPSFSERLAALEALNRGAPAEAQKLLGGLEESAVEQPGETYVLSNWLVRHGKASEAREWLDTLSPEQRKQAPVPMAYAECLVSLRDWKTLQEHLTKEKWEDAEILRHAFILRADRELTPFARTETGLSEWRLALRSQKVRPAELYLAANLFWSWGWKSEAEDIWWTLSEQSPNPEMALRRLDQIYRAEKNTGKLWRISQIAHQSNPRDKVAQNNYAMLSLLLNLDQKNAQVLAESLYRAQTENPAFLSTYAFSLYRQGRTKEALRLFSTLNPVMLEIPELAFYNAVFLKADGQNSESTRYAKLAEKASLLPEEKALLP